jgi:hypothetical protein
LGDKAIKFADEQQLRNEIKEVRSDNVDTDWYIKIEILILLLMILQLYRCLCGYEGGKGNTIISLGKGNGGLDELLSHLKVNII